MNLDEMRVDSAIKQKGITFYIGVGHYLDCCIGCSFDHIAYFDEKPAHILLYSPPYATGIHDFKNN